jgi:hypothetical protein
LLAALQRSALRKRHHFQQPIEIGFVREAIERGVLLEKNIIESANRIRRLKQQIAGDWSKFSGRAYSNNGTGDRC